MKLSAAVCNLPSYTVSNRKEEEGEDGDRNIWLNTSWRIVCFRASFLKSLIPDYPLFLTSLNNPDTVKANLLVQLQKMSI